MADNTNREPTSENQKVTTPLNKIGGATIAMIVAAVIFLVIFAFLAASFFSNGYGLDSDRNNPPATRANP